nr:hypothetical protein [Tanacetum cinerariifolium]
EPIIVSDESKEEEEVSKDKDTKATSHDSQKEELEQAKAEVASMKAKPSDPDIHQLTKLMGMDKGTKNYSFNHIFTGSNPSVLVDKTKYAGDGLKIAHTNSGANEESRADDISLKVKLEDLSDILKDTRSAFFTPDSLPDEPIIVSDESKEEEEVSKDKDTKATSHDVTI